MRNICFFLLVFFIVIPGKSQQDPRAKEILDQFSAKSKNLQSFKANIEFIYYNGQTKETTTKQGMVMVKGAKYKLVFDDSHLYSDGQAVYTFLPKSKEVAITNPGIGKEEFFLSNPSRLFNIYNKDYKYKYLGDEKCGSSTCYSVDLYPNEKGQSYFRVNLLISSDQMELVSAKAFEKTGVSYEVKIFNLQKGLTLNDQEFTFDVKLNPEVEVIDMR